MNLFLRLCRIIIQAFFRAPLGFFNTSVLEFTVWLHDLDINRHMTNSRYLSLMDLGRTDLLIRSGLAKKVYQLKWSPVLGAATIRWRKALNLFDRCQLHTRTLGWDEKWIYIEQRVTCKGFVHAIAVVKGLFVSHDGSVPIQRVVDLINPGVQSPELPYAIKLWFEMEEEMRNLLSKEQEKG